MMKHRYLRNRPLIRLLLLLLTSLFLFSCSFSKLSKLSTYEDFADVSNTLWANIYFKLVRPQVPHYDRVIYKDTRWQKQDGPVMLDGSMFVLPGVSLTIDPGVTVMLAKDVMISCQGIIIARGTESEPVVFTHQQEGEYWDAIQFNNCLKDTKAGGSRVILDHCLIEYGQGVIVNSSEAHITASVIREQISSAIKFEYASGLIAGNKIYNNSTKRQAETGNGAGINVYTDKTVRIENNDVYDNYSNGGRDGGGGIYAFAYNEGQVTVINNTIRNNRSDRKAGGIFAFTAEVTGNTVTNNQSDLYGGGIFTINSIIRDNIVTGNKSHQGGGIYSEHGELIHNLVRDNTADQGIGLYHLGDGIIQYNTFTENRGLQPDNYACLSLSGNPFLEDNNIIAPGGYALEFLSHSLSPDLKAHNNYWGTADKAVIEALIHDWLEDTEVGLVSWDHYRSAPVAKAFAVGDDAALRTTVTAVPAAAGTIRGVIESDTILGDRDDNKQYTVSGNLLVQKGVRLEIAAGTELFLKENATIRVRGQLTAVGDKRHLIRFTGDRERPWGRMFFENRSLDEAGQAAALETENRLSHCLIENGSGLLMDGYGAEMTYCTIKNNRGTGIRIKESEATIKDCRIEGNTSDSDGGGIYVYGSKPVFIYGNQISGNTAADGGGVFAYGYLSNVAVDIRDNIITANTSLGDGGGIWVSRSAVVGNRVNNNHTDAKGGGIFASFALINGNQINDNTAEKGGGLFVEANSSIADNIIAGNSISGKTGGGAFLNYWGISLHNKKFAANIVEDNTASGADHTGGVVMAGKMAFGGNVIRANSGFQLFNQNPADVEEITAKDCFWETSDQETIDEMIFDGLDDPALSVVDYRPVARTKEGALAKGKELEDIDEKKDR